MTAILLDMQLRARRVFVFLMALCSGTREKQPEKLKIDKPKRQLSAGAFAVGHRLYDPHPDVHQAEAADHAAHEAVIEELLHRRKPDQQGVVGPQARPGKNGQDDADFQTKQDEHNQPQALQPAVGTLRVLRRRHDQHRPGRRRLMVRALGFGEKIQHHAGVRQMPERQEQRPAVECR